MSGPIQSTKGNYNLFDIHNIQCTLNYGTDEVITMHSTGIGVDKLWACVLTSLQVNLGGASSSEGAADLSHTVASVFVTAHRSVVEMSERMLFEMKRHNYVTPTNYLELVTGYKRYS